MRTDLVEKTAAPLASVIALAGIDVNVLWDRLKATDPIVEFRTESKIQMAIACERPFDRWNLAGRVYQNVVKKPELAEVLKIGSAKKAGCAILFVWEIFWIAGLISMAMNCACNSTTTKPRIQAIAST